MPNKANPNEVSVQEEIFIQELLRGNTQRKAYIKAYPKRTYWKESAIDSAASTLLKKEKVRKRYDELVVAMRAEEVEKTQWTREQSIETLRYVIDKNKQDVERIEAACEEELQGLLEQIQKDPTNAARYAQAALKQRKSRRLSAIHNQGIVSAVAELNKMQGYNEETINMNNTVHFVGEEDIPE
jgi:hypothetical protein